MEWSGEVDVLCVHKMCAYVIIILVHVLFLFQAQLFNAKRGKRQSMKVVTGRLTGLAYDFSFYATLKARAQVSEN